MEFDVNYALSILPDLVRGAVITLAATVCGMALALLGGLILSIFQMSRVRVLSLAASSVVQVVRNTPLLVQLFFLFYLLPDFGISSPAFMTGVLGLGLHYSAYTAEVYRAGIEGVPRGQWEASRSLHLSSGVTWSRIVLPQAIPPMVPVLGNYLIAMFKDTPLLATITVVELFGASQQAAGSSYRYVEPYTIVGLIFLILSLPSAWLVSRAERRLSPRGA